MIIELPSTLQVIGKHAVLEPEVLHQVAGGIAVCDLPLAQNTLDPIASDIFHQVLLREIIPCLGSPA
jgi:hypothetical protein